MHSQCFSNHNLGLHENVNQKQTHWKAAGGVRGGRAKEERSEAQQEMNREAQCARIRRCEWEGKRENTTE